MKVEVFNLSSNPLPQYATPQSSGLDLRANLKESVVMQPLERKIIPTGLKIALPPGYEAQVRARSGLAIKHGVTVLNGVGTIDADYRGDIGVILVNLSNQAFTISPGERVAQLVVSKVEAIEWQEMEVLEETNRGNGGFGSTGAV